ncbi:uncharacterized protein NESG_02016 [Nematocida ausubeli]|uniref:Uncharacterized protein n=1 Tax=Nematocida ausubeli (strain ATCC PRA-371 / ERTm2) TaxID=1913371 RepID=A0A086IZC8_NEMA1|nr:uncharacterized protein NESG_02016 [Nematocida ausubeli]KFG25246.1 hypothetical protein NESG_02016 [Nematocida ausubeli]
MHGIQFQKVQTIMRVPVYPCQLNNIIEYSYKYLNKYVGLYIKALKGVVICYTDSIGILDEIGYISGIDPKVHVKVSVEFIIMKIIRQGLVHGYIQGHTGYIHGIIPVKISGNIIDGSYTYTITDVNMHPLCVHGEISEE